MFSHSLLVYFLLSSYLSSKAGGSSWCKQYSYLFKTCLMIIELVDNTLDSDEEVAALGQLFTICITAPEVVKKEGARCLFCTSIVAEACRTHVLNNRRGLPGFLTNLDLNLC